MLNASSDHPLLMRRIGHQRIKKTSRSGKISPNEQCKNKQRNQVQMLNRIFTFRRSHATTVVIILWETQKPLWTDDLSSIETETVRVELWCLRSCSSVEEGLEGEQMNGWRDDGWWRWVNLWASWSRGQCCCLEKLYKLGTLFVEKSRRGVLSRD